MGSFRNNNHSFGRGNRGIDYLLYNASNRRKKWKQDKRDKLQEKRREAIELALEWLEPMSKAISRAESLTSGLIFQRITEDHFRKNWPDLLSQLSNQDIPIQLRYRLSSNIYARGHQIIQELEKLQYLNLVSYPKDEDEFKGKLEECSKIIAHLNQTLRELEEELIEEHKKTYQ